MHEIIDPKVLQARKLIFRTLIEQRIEIGAIHSVLAAKDLLTREELDQALVALRADSKAILDQRKNE